MGFSLKGLAQAGTTNKGTEFWTAYMDHVNGAGNLGSRMSLYITSNVNTTGVVELADGTFSQNFIVRANDVTIVDIPASAFLGESTVDIMQNKGIHITSVKPIAVYAHIYRNSVSGATLLLPVGAMGKDYYSINYKQMSNSDTGRDGVPSYSVFCIVATEDDTQVEITPSADLISGHPAGTTFTISLKKGEVYQGLSAKDLTGTHIRSIGTATASCKKIAMFSGSSKIGIGCNGNESTGLIDATSDNLFQQVYPTAAWGKNYYAVPLAGRGYDIFRVVYSDASAQVKVDGMPVSPTGGYYEYTSQTPTIVTSDKPIQLVQYTVSQGEGLNCSRASGDLGDPEMIYLSPIEQGLDQVTLYSTSRPTISRSYINVVIPTNAVASFRLDNVAKAELFQPMPGDNSYSYAQLPVDNGTHNIRADRPFNAIAYGFGPNDSYGYAAGTNLRNLNEYVTLNNVVTNTTSSSGCSGTDYAVQLALPYANVASIQWRFSNGAPSFSDINPTYTSTRLSTDGVTTLYVFEYKDKINYPPGTYTITASIPNPDLNDCGSLRDIEFDFTITNFPVADFKSTTSLCERESMMFEDVTDAQGSIITKWLWEFGDVNSTADNPNTSTDPKPQHIFTQPGIYHVKLTVFNENGCSSFKEKDIKINHLPVAAFTIGPACIGNPVAFTSNSTSIDGNITKWIWNFGDVNGNTTDNVSDLPNPQHTYSQPGTYLVTLQVVTDLGCISTIASKNIVVRPLPVVSFQMPEVCLNDNFAQFASTSTIADHTETDFTYEWNFGDPASGAANTSTLKEPKHRYSAAGNYMVTLKVTSGYGCSEVLVQSFTVNGAVTRASFMPAVPAFCSSEDAVFKTNNEVGFGHVTRIVFYYDFGNNPAQSTEYRYSNNQIPADNLFRYRYPLNNSLTPRTYTVRMIVYSGESCFLEDTKQVTINPNPLITLQNKPVVLCQDDEAIQINQNLNGFTGTGKFTGKGVTAGGLFDSRIAGAGVHTINYVFTTATAGCAYAESFHVTVNPKPVINMPAEVSILSGGFANINASATLQGGGQLRYQWTLDNGTTAIGLDKYNLADPVANPAQDTRYMLTVTSASGCTSFAYITVKVLQGLVVPNTFTPNGDGVNDTWQIRHLESYPNCMVEIFNRNGEKVYSARNYAIPWDGRYGGRDLPAGTYYYIIDPKNGRSVISGPVTIIR